MATVFTVRGAEERAWPAAAAAAPISASRVHLHYFENMRGLAILLVIAAHCLGLAWSGTATRWFDHDPVLSIVTGGTPIFVFISGFFFHHVFRHDFDYVAFVARKARSLLPAYLAVTAVLLLIEHAMGIDAVRYGPIQGLADRYFMALYAGASGPAMWYVPFVFDLFLLSPLVLLFLHARPSTQCAVLAVALVIGVLVDRSYLNRLHNLEHFGFYYLLGAFSSLHRARFEALLRRRRTTHLAAAAIVVLAIAEYRFGRVEAAGMATVWPAFKFLYFGKIALVLLLASLALRYADRPIPWLSKVSEWSFALFFVHQIPLLLLRPMAIAGAFNLGPGYFGLAWCVAVVFAMSMGMIWAARQLLGHRSRYLIGV